MLGRKVFGGSLLGGSLGGLLGVLLFGLFAAGCSDEPSSPRTLFSLGDASPGAVVSLRDAGDGVVEWVEREAGRIMSLDTDADGAAASIVAELDVATDGQQWGLLSTLLLDDGRRFAAWTMSTGGDEADLVVGELVDGETPRLVWNAGSVGSGGIGGVMDVLDGRLLIGLGQNVEWTNDNANDGAFVSLDPDGDVDQAPIPIGDGYINPWAFVVVDDTEVWVADNAAGPDADDPDADDVERIGRADLDDRGDMARSTEPDRAPAAMIELDDGRLGICGFLDNELRAYEIVDADTGARSELERAGTIMSCNTAAVALDDGTLITTATTDDGEALQILTP
ncbi:MAG: hypothetical protein AB8G26_10990 [Ilumatobacter sp.]